MYTSLGCSLHDCTPCPRPQSVTIGLCHLNLLFSLCRHFSNRVESPNPHALISIPGSRIHYTRTSGQDGPHNIDIQPIKPLAIHLDDNDNLPARIRTYSEAPQVVFKMSFASVLSLDIPTFDHLHNDRTRPGQVLFLLRQPSSPPMHPVSFLVDITYAHYLAPTC
ncbi:hypothetical protein QCA50_008297 [Cerrena zonata]|uniref:Uncharacterized protein n=1 Tax=Cerrena zonata TaxID=2478898 RepID=A0AAW0GF73_9APHY